MSTSTRNIIAWILQALLGAAFVFFGGKKLSDMNTVIANFGGMGFPAWFAWFIAIAELVGGIGLFIPRLARLAAVGLTVIMIGALVLHATKIPGGIQGGGAAIAMLVLLMVLVWLRRPAPLAVA